MSAPSIAIVKEPLPAPITKTLEPTLNPAPPAKTWIWLINPEKISDTIALAGLVACPPVTITGSPTL